MARSGKVPIEAIAALATETNAVFVSDPNDWNDLVEAAAIACQDLGVGKQAWGHACQTMGRYPAAASVVLIALKWERDLIWSPEGYLRGMTQRAAAGELHLARSVFGWLMELGKAVMQPAGRGSEATR